MKVLWKVFLSRHLGGKTEFLHQALVNFYSEALEWAHYIVVLELYWPQL